MPVNDDHATTCSIAELNSTLLNKKLRIAGKILAYDPVTYLLLLAHHPHGILVDMSLCLDPSTPLHYLRESKGTLMLIGSLEMMPLDVPVLSQFVDAPSLDDRLVLRAIVASSMNGLSLDRWNASLQVVREVSGAT